MSKWIYNGKHLKEPPEGAIGFIYKITWGDAYYIGKKNFYSTTNKTLTKTEVKAIKEVKGRKGKIPKKKKKVSESNWKIYESTSSDVIFREAIKQHPEKFYYEVLEIAYNSTELTMLEAKHILCPDALRDKNCLNKELKIRILKSNL